MPKHVIVDGFNVIRRDPELSHIEKGNFYGAQESLIDKLARYRRGTSHKVTVVLDGHSSENTYRQRREQKGINVVFSAQGETADDVIEEMVAAAAANRSAYMVITADRALADACRAQRVIVLPPDELMRKSRPATMPFHEPDFVYGKREEDGWVGHTKKKGNARRKSKRKRSTRSLW